MCLILCVLHSVRVSDSTAAASRFFSVDRVVSGLPVKLYKRYLTAFGNKPFENPGLDRPESFRSQKQKRCASI